VVDIYCTSITSSFCVYFKFFKHKTVEPKVWLKYDRIIYRSKVHPFTASPTIATIIHYRIHEVVTAAIQDGNCGAAIRFAVIVGDQNNGLQLQGPPASATALMGKPLYRG
jgi:hypothetical protein